MVQYFYESNQAKPPGNAPSVDRLGVIHLVRALNFLKSGYFLLPDTHTYVCVSRVKKCEFTNDPLQQWNNESWGCVRSAEAYSEPRHTSKIERFAKIVNG